MIEIRPVEGIAEVVSGDDLPRLLADALGQASVEAGDVLVVTSKIVSKAQGRFVALADTEPSPEAVRLAAETGKDPRLAELVLRESSTIIRAVPSVLIARHHSGAVMANAGIDASNLGPGEQERVLLLPEDCDAAAREIANGIEAILGTRPAVVVSDSFGRPWRHGVVNVALGCDGFPALLDRRGEPDREGRAMQVTQVALADLVASAAGLAMGEGAEGIPAAVVRGLDLGGDPRPAADLVRPLEQDLFR